MLVEQTIQPKAQMTIQLPNFSDGHVRELDGIRGLAVLMVVILHCYIGIGGAKGDFPFRWLLTGHLASGVDLFFVLSGFLIGGILLEHKNAPNYFLVFWVRRATRILPVYILLLLSYRVGLSALQGPATDWSADWLLLDPLPFWRYLTFTQNFEMAQTAATGALWVGITWTLGVEEQFYLLVPFVVYFLPKRVVLALATAVIVLVPLYRQSIWDAGLPYYSGYFPTLARADALMFGVIGAYVIRAASFRSLQPYLGWWSDGLLGLVVLILLTAPLPQTVQFSTYGLAGSYAVIRCYGADGYFRSALRNKFLVQLGLISFPLYMYHQAVNGLVHGFIFQAAPDASGSKGWAALLVVVISLSLAIASTRYFEAPFRKLGRRIRYLAAPIADQSLKRPASLGLE